MPKSFTRIPEETYFEFVRSLYDTLRNTAIMAIAFIGSGILLSLHTHDPTLSLLAIVGAAAAASRFVTLAIGKHWLARAALTRASARRLERWFAASYLSFALVFGLFCVRGIAVGGTETHALLVGLLFGYAAGAAIGVSFRPWISVTAATVAIAPTMFFTLLSGDILQRAAGLLLAAFLAGGVVSMIERYRHAAESVSMKHLFASLARTDGLTGLANRLALAERFQEIAQKMPAGTMMAVHCIDLDRFKPINDRYGHPFGDQLLQAVAQRLRQMLRSTDVVARTGGDEFVVIQPKVTDPSEAELLARRIGKMLAAPYTIEGQEIVVGASVGYAVHGADSCSLDALIAGADAALLRAKDERGSIVCGDIRTAAAP